MYVKFHDLNINWNKRKKMKTAIVWNHVLKKKNNVTKLQCYNHKGMLNYWKAIVYIGIKDVWSFF